MSRKLFVIGLDSAPPQLVFEQFRSDLPNIGGLIEAGSYATLKSCDPPITIPAWMVACTGKGPGTLGLYGFRHRKGYSYSEGWIASSLSIKEDKIWDILARKGKKVCLVGIPPSYPPTPVNGSQISCFITPDSGKDYTYPIELKREIEELVGEYIFDVEFRTDERDRLLQDLYKMTERRFHVIKYLMKSRPWDFFMFVEIGLDRVHHAFWKYFDREHDRYEAGNRYEDVIRNYYRFLDFKLGELLELLDEDTAVALISDHGAKRMKGAFCVNEWLMQEGLLRLNEKPSGIISLEKASIDWSRSLAWGWGGYYARIYLNVKGRESRGVIEPSEYEVFREDLSERLIGIKDPSGHRMATRVIKPDKHWSPCRGDYPDLMVYFDDLYWRSAGTIGHNSIYLDENDTGPDDSVHSHEGIFIFHDLTRPSGGRNLGVVDILDVAPTFLTNMGVEVPNDMEGRVLGEA